MLPKKILILALILGTAPQAEFYAKPGLPTKNAEINQRKKERKLKRKNYKQSKKNTFLMPQ